MHGCRCTRCFAAKDCSAWPHSTGKLLVKGVDSSAQLLSAQLLHEPPGVPEMSVSERPHQDLVEALRVEGIVGDLCRGTDRWANIEDM